MHHLQFDVKVLGLLVRTTVFVRIEYVKQSFDSVIFSSNLVDQTSCFELVEQLGISN